MTSRALQYFMQPSECLALIHMVIDQLHLESWLISAGVTKHVELVLTKPSLTMSNNRPVYWIGLSRTCGGLDPCFSGRLMPGAWGWVLVEIPRRSDNALYLAQMSAKSDWIDPESGEARNDKTSIDLFHAISKIFKSQLRHPAWIQDPYSGNAVPCKGVWYSKGAIDWEQQGIELRQEGVQNTLFTVK
jgi:hypothetical protein